MQKIQILHEEHHPVPTDQRMIGTNKENILKSSNDFFSELTVVPELGRQMQANTCEFEVSLLYIVKLCLKYVNAIFLFMMLKKN